MCLTALRSREDGQAFQTSGASWAVGGEELRIEMEAASLVHFEWNPVKHFAPVSKQVAEKLVYALDLDNYTHMSLVRLEQETAAEISD